MGVRFQSVGNCVAKVQQHPFAGILFILFHDSALDVAARVEDFFDVRHQLFTGMQCLQETAKLILSPSSIFILGVMFASFNVNAMLQLSSAKTSFFDLQF